METTLHADPAPLEPIRTEARIQALDVVRGFALLGIFLMNVEWFNRASGEMGVGLPQGLGPADWWASRLIYIFVQGKFWTMFSLLFGMGFAVMLTRAELAGRSFLKPYLRRIAALALFGAVHHIFIWSGDILYSYAVTAVALLIVLFGNWKYVLGALPLLVGLGFIPKADAIWGVAVSLGYIGFLALYLRHERRLTLAGRSLPVFAFVLMLLGGLGELVSIALWVLPKVPLEPRIIVPVLSTAILLLGGLWASFRDPEDQRLRRLGMTVYLFPCLIMTTFGAIQRFVPTPREVVEARATAQAQVQAQPQLLTQPAPKPEGVKEAKKPTKTEAERRVEGEIERLRGREEHKREVQQETLLHAKGRYRDVVKFRAKKFVERLPNEAGFATIVVGMFLLGAWFVRSGIMARTRDHLPLFRKLAFIAFPAGLALALLSARIATSHVPGANQDGWGLAQGMMMAACLPMSLGYAGFMVVFLHSDSILSKVSLLAPVGRMALTNYLMQSLISAFYFFGHGLGHWGMARAWQVVYVFAVFVLQVGFSHWWLGRFRYGPMEWLWRAITYWQIPPMRLEKPTPGGTLRAVETPVP